MTRVVTTIAIIVTLLVAFASPAFANPITITQTAIVLRDPIYFESGKPAIKQESLAQLDALAAAITADKKISLIEIQGHTDARGNDQYNLEMSQKRADAVRAHLISKGVAPNRLRAKGYGETRPIDKGSNEAAWAKNRRTAFVILQRSA